MSSLAGWRECGGHRFYKQRGYIWVYENSWDLVPRELHFYSKAERKTFSRHLPIPGWTFPHLVGFWALVLFTSFCLLSSDSSPEKPLPPHFRALSPLSHKLLDRTAPQQWLEWIATPVAGWWCVPHLQKLPMKHRGRRAHHSSLLFFKSNFQHSPPSLLSTKLWENITINWLEHSQQLLPSSIQG